MTHEQLSAHFGAVTRHAMAQQTLFAHTLRRTNDIGKRLELQAMITANDANIAINARVAAHYAEMSLIATTDFSDIYNLSDTLRAQIGDIITRR